MKVLAEALVSSPCSLFSSKKWFRCIFVLIGITKWKSQKQQKSCFRPTVSRHSTPVADHKFEFFSDRAT